MLLRHIQDMGVCMGKDSTAITSDLLEPDGRFISSRRGGGDGGGDSGRGHGHKMNNNEGSALANGGGGGGRVGGGGGGDERLSPPRTPIIFVLGGPGSGKITHCDRVVQERAGLAHINMTDLIQQHIVGNGLQDFSLIPPANLIEVLQMELKMAVNARGYLISGYPRSMRDVVEYQNKLQRIDAVVLLNWHIRILEKQIEYGSQLGETVLQLARMELKNYSKNVLAVAEYFDQLDKLTVVDGERQPTEVYDDFLAAVDASLAAASGGGGALGSLVMNKGAKQKGGDKGRGHGMANGVGNKGIISTADVPLRAARGVTMPPSIGSGLKVIWIIGGPGSNKSLLSSTSVRLHHGGLWEWLSIGEELRRLVGGGGGGGGSHRNGLLSPDQIIGVRNALAKGELVRDEIILAIVGEALGKTRSRKRGWVLDGFPRTLKQVEGFRDQFPLVSPPPPCILVDCSEVELGRSLGQRSNNRLAQQREDDHNSAAVRKRLQLYRTVTLPTLKILDDQHRLHIIDGDLEDKGRIVEEFNETLGSLIEGYEAEDEGGGQMGGGRGQINPNRLGVTSHEKRKPSTDTINGMYNEVQQNSE